MKTHRFIAISGADGSGKTTLAKYLVNYNNIKGHKSRYVWIKARHTMAYIVSQALIKLGWHKTFRNPNGVIVSRFEIPKSAFSKYGWPFIEFISILPLIVFKVWIPIRLGYKIIADRYILDTIVTISLNTRNMNFVNSFFGNLLLKMTPKNSFIFLLDIDISTVLKRRRDIEYSKSEIEYMIILYRLLATKTKIHPLNVNTKSIEQVNNIIVSTLYNEQIPETSIAISKPINFSIVIPTINREVKLKNVLISILKQEIFPIEVIVVDQSDTNRTFLLVNEMKQTFSDKKIILKYFYMKQKSGSKARNYGLDYSKGDVVFLIDDDVILLQDYIKNILKIYETYPDAVGVQGFILFPTGLEKMKSASGRLENLFRRVFYLTHFRKDVWKIMPSLNDIFPFPLTTTISTQRLQGCCSFRRDILMTQRYDENLPGWSFLEDLDLSYRIYKSQIGSIYITPEAKLIHTEHQHMVRSLKEESYKKIINRAYMFFKLVKQTPKNYIIFYWSLLGLLLTTIIGSIVEQYSGTTSFKNDSKQHEKYIPIYYISAIFYMIKHFKEIKNLDLNFLK